LAFTILRSFENLLKQIHTSAAFAASAFSLTFSNSLCTNEKGPALLELPESDSGVALLPRELRVSLKLENDFERRLDAREDFKLKAEPAFEIP
jgi:hypothetical protein